MNDKCTCTEPCENHKLKEEVKVIIEHLNSHGHIIEADLLGDDDAPDYVKETHERFQNDMLPLLVKAWREIELQMTNSYLADQIAEFRNRAQQVLVDFPAIAASYAIEKFVESYILKK